jgi:hypothetical protein
MTRKAILLIVFVLALWVLACASTATMTNSEIMTTVIVSTPIP